MAIRKVLVRRRAKVDLSSLEQRLQSIAESMRQVAEMQKAIDADKATLFADMKTAKITQLDVPEAEAAITQSKGRSTGYIDPRTLRKLLKSDDEFYDCLTVSLTKAKGVLPGKVYDRINNVTDGKLGEPTLTIKLTV